MKIQLHSDRPVFALPGISHRTLVQKSDGVNQIEVWMQTLAPGSETPIHYHECEETVTVLRGSGVVVLEDSEVPFGPQSTIIFPPRLVHTIRSTGSEDMEVVVCLSETPGRAFTPDGIEIPLPWLAVP